LDGEIKVKAEKTYRIQAEEFPVAQCGGKTSRSEGRTKKQMKAKSNDMQRDQ
jgi:hypothetical protein